MLSYLDLKHLSPKSVTDLNNKSLGLLAADVSELKIIKVDTKTHCHDCN